MENTIRPCKYIHCTVVDGMQCPFPSKLLKVINVQFQVLDLRLRFPVSKKEANQKLNTVK